MGFESLSLKSVKHFGGDYLKNSNPKTKRPLSTKRPLHLVVRSSMATGRLSFLRHAGHVEAIIKRQERKHGVKVYRQANAGNHLHLIVLPSSRLAFNRFVRSITGLIARRVLNTERGRGKNLRFWDKRPYTRIVEWGREYKGVCAYLLQNTLEALGFIPYKPRKRKVKARAGRAPPAILKTL